MVKNQLLESECYVLEIVGRTLVIACAIEIGEREKEESYPFNLWEIGYLYPKFNKQALSLLANN